MSSEMNNPDKLAFSTRCLPGSPAEQEEAERLAEFHRNKAQRQADELRERQEAAARRVQKHLNAAQTQKERLQRDRTRHLLPKLPQP